VTNDTLFEILVYSCDQDEFLNVVTAKVDKLMAQRRGSLNAFGTTPAQEQRDEELRTQMRDKGIQSELKPIRYNELVGCIEVHTVFTQLRADYWFTEKKRILIGSKVKGIVNWCGKLLEKEYRGSQLTSHEVFRDFRGCLTRAAGSNARLRRRYIDFEAFDRCGPFVDWRAALHL
jgi:hypothetical protein